jgi:hypothetical protein
VSLWGLIFGGALPFRVGDQVKIVWRMTGTGPLAVTQIAPDGSTRPLTFGPSYHTSSSYHRPGQEWGTGFTFNVTGCWTIRLTRTTGAADAYFEVEPAGPTTT